MEKCNGKGVGRDHEYTIFQPLPRGAAAPKGCKKITYHIVFDCKRFIAGGHRLDIPAESSFAGIVRFAVRMALFLGVFSSLQNC